MTPAFGPYSPSRFAGDLLFVSGQVGVDPDTKQAPRDIKQQTSQVLMNMSKVLADADLSMSAVIKTTIFVTDMGMFSDVNEVYEQFFAEPRPARSTVCVAELPRVGGKNPILVEIEAVAYNGGKQ